ncbi:hypothetical protein QR680_015672 [Steinernema hermaphroditum]|uniref:G-protein coupled receptors family 1 profile domain-containing protein n=1 Tax=Steinernema hermaphroditum TaxID=289476 RepID=A0AA39LLB3_9BILA|nr:hypothetical protein QR680_015672 [Steinernema hermaphroditum]
MELFVATSILIYVIGAIGIFGNINIIIAIYRLKPRMKSSLLVGLVACCDTICILSEFQNATRNVLYVQSYRKECFWAISSYLFMCKMQTTLMCALAFDRFLAFVLPFRYLKFRDSRYLVACCIPGISFGIFFLTFAALNMEDGPIVACNPPLAYPPMVMPIWNDWSVTFDTLTLVLSIAALIAMAIRTYQLKRSSKRSNENEMLKKQKSLSKSCSVMIVIFLLTTYFGHFGMNIIRALGASQDVEDTVLTMAVLPAMVAYSQAFYVYFWSSRLYRDAFKEQLNFILPSNMKISLSESRVTAVTSISVNE